MTVRSTSREAYRDVMDSGYVGRKQKEVYDGLFTYGPATGTELYYAMGWHRNPTHSNIVTRLGELRELGVVRESGKRECERTGKTAIVWDVTDGKPVKPTKPDLIECPHCEGRGHFEQRRLL